MEFELRWKQRFANFERAWQVFCRILGRYHAAPSDEETFYPRTAKLYEELKKRCTG